LRSKSLFLHEGTITLLGLEHRISGLLGRIPGISRILGLFSRDFGDFADGNDSNGLRLDSKKIRSIRDFSGSIVVDQGFQENQGF